VNGRVWEEQFWNAGEQTSGWLASLELCDALLAQANLRERFEKLVQRKFEAIVIDGMQ
jgi:hypothetical protein